MGAGCYYTNGNGALCPWIDIGLAGEDADDDEQFFHQSYEFQSIWEEICALKEASPKHRSFSLRDCSIRYGVSFLIRLESTSDGAGVLIYMDNLTKEGDRGFELSSRNWHSAYDKVLRHLNQSFPLVVATGGYTAKTLDIGTFKGI